MPFDIEAARKDGVPDSQIADYLAGSAGFDIQAARKDGANDSEIADYLSQKISKISSSQEQPGFFDRVSKDLNDRSQQEQDTIDAYAQGKIDAPAAMIKGIGTKIFAPVADTLGEIAKTIWQSDPNEPIQKAITDAAKATGSYVSDSAVGDVARQYGSNIQDFAKAHPDIAATTEGAAQIAQFLPIGKAADMLATNVVKPTIRTVGDLASGAEGLAEEYAKKYPVGTAPFDEIVPKPSLSPEMQKVFNRLRADFPNDEEFKRALNSYASKQGQTLLEAAGEKTANLAEGAAMYPSGSAKASEFFNEAAGSAPEKIKGTLSKTVSPNINYYDTLDSIVETGRKNAAPIYNAAFKANQSVKSPIIDKILQTPEGKAALKSAVEDMQNEMARVAKPDPELSAMAKEASDIGLMDPQKGGVASGLKLRTIDYIKKSMDDTIKKALREGDDAQVRRIGNLKRSLVEEADLADKGGLYAKARAVSGDYLSNKSAMDSGLDFLKDDPEVIGRFFKGMGKSEKEAYKNGVVKAIRSNIDNKIDGRNVTEIFQRPATRQKLQNILNKTEYNKLLADVGATDKIFKLKNQITGNSRSVLRKVASEEFDNAGHEFIADAAQNGFIKTSVKNGIQFIKKSFDGMSDKMASDVADILYESDPKKKYQIVKQLVNEANYQGGGTRKVEAAKKLGAFYSISDKVNKSKTELKLKGTTP